MPIALVNDIFISHLHTDHYADLPYMYPFRAFLGGFTPLRVYGPSGRTPELGTKHMVKHMREMNRWHEENFSAAPVGYGLDIQVTEFDWRERNGVCYDKDGVVVRHWPRSHVKDGASAYRLDWEEAGLSFVWTGDGRPEPADARLQHRQVGFHRDHGLVQLHDLALEADVVSVLVVGGQIGMVELRLDRRAAL